MLEREIDELSNLPKVGHRAISAFALIDYIKRAVLEEKPIDLEKMRLHLEDCKKIKKKSEKDIERDILKQIESMDSDTLNEMAFIVALEAISQNENDNEPINKEDFNHLMEYELFLMKNGLIGKPIQTVEYNGYYAQQFPNFKILFLKNNEKAVLGNCYKKATKQELKKSIDDIIAGKIGSRV